MPITQEVLNFNGKIVLYAEYSKGKVSAVDTNDKAAQVNEISKQLAYPMDVYVYARKGVNFTHVVAANLYSESKAFFYNDRIGNIYVYSEENNPMLNALISFFNTFAAGKISKIKRKDIDALLRLVGAM